MRWSRFAPPHFLLHRLRFLFWILSHIIGLQAIPTPLQRGLLIYFSHQQQAPRFEITKSGSCRIHLLYPAQKCFDKHQKSSQRLTSWRWRPASFSPADMEPLVDCSNQQRNCIWINLILLHSRKSMSPSIQSSDMERQFRKEGIKQGRMIQCRCTLDLTEEYILKCGLHT